MTSPQATNACDLTSISALVQLHHTFASNPVSSTWFAAIKAGNYGTYLGLALLNAMKHCPSSDTTVKGHLKQTHQGLCSTNSKPSPSSNYFAILSTPDKPLTEIPSIKPSRKPTKLPLTNKLNIADIPLSKLYTDITGRLPIQACSSNQYIPIAYHSNAT
jgi:hypothetical protein